MQGPVAAYGRGLRALHQRRFYREAARRGDGATGLTYFGVRWYDGESGRFMSRDPIRDGWNWHAYVGGDPINMIDLWGLFGQALSSDSPMEQVFGARYNEMAESYGGRPETPYQQNDPELNDIQNMASDGCNFRVYQHVVERYTGVNMTAEEIAEAVETLQNTPDQSNPDQMVLEENMTVNNPDQVMDHAFDVLGYPELRATAGYGGDTDNPDFQNRRGTTSNDNSHSQLLDKEGNMIFDPYDPDISGLSNTYTYDIFIRDK